MPATVQERWFARLYLALPLLVATLAVFWILSGAIGLFSMDRAIAVVAPQALAEATARFVVVAGAIVDILLGCAVLYRPWAKLACLGMVATTVIYLLGATVLLPALWTDPLGPLIKTLPALMLALITSMLLEER